MNIKKRGLGRTLSDLGLNALLGDLKAPEAPIVSTDVVPDAREQLKKLPIQCIKPGIHQPRKWIAPEALNELAQSIRTQGVIQPIVVRPTQNNQYEIIAGERRWRAAQLAELEYIPAIVREMNDETAMIVALIENVQRHDLNVIEEATALNRLMNEFNMTHQAVADAVGKSRTTVTNLLRLLKLPQDVLQQLQKNQLEMGHARALLSLPEEKQNAVAAVIIAKQLSVRETEDYIRKLLETNLSNTDVAAKNTILFSAQEKLHQRLGLTVSISKNAKGQGKLSIQFNSEKELEDLLDRIH